MSLQPTTSKYEPKTTWDVEPAEERTMTIDEYISERDSHWCQAILSVVTDTYDIEKIMRAFNEIRSD